MMGNTLLTTTEKMGLGLQTTGLGLLVVFAALFLIILIIVLLSGILRERKKPVEEPAPAEAEPAPVQQTDDGELVAVLTAAVAYCMTGDPANTSGLVIRSYRKTQDGSAWGKAGRNSQIFNKL